MWMRISLFLMCVLCFLQSDAQKADQVLMTVGDYPVSVGEFRYIYEKNNGASADYSEKSLKEYLELYTRFKLKVQKAKAMHLDTIADLKTELAGYRKQLASSYLIDKEVTDELLKELFERMKYDVEFHHIFIPAAESASAKVKEDARLKLLDVKAKIVAGMPFEEAAIQYSEDKQTASSGGYMGYFTARMPSGFYNVETALYNTPVGGISDVVESKIGYHIIKVTNKRPARGQIEVAHILFKSDQKDFADKVYNDIKEGKLSFEDAVAMYSSDRNTVKNKGLLPPFGINTYDPVFEELAFSLQQDGEVSQPVLTRSGWHIIKRVSRPERDSYEVFVRRNKSQISKDQRFDVAKFKLIEDIKKSNEFRYYPQNLNSFRASLNDEFYSYKWTPDEQMSALSLVEIGKKKTYTTKDFAEYCRKNTRLRLKYDKSKPINEIVDELYREYVNEIALDYEEQQLEAKYPDFKSLMREYEEGILLFEATKLSVWDKANQDTTGLEHFFEQHRDRYLTEEKAEAEIYTVSGGDKKLNDKILAYARKNSGEQTLKKFNTNKKTVVEYSKAEYDRKSKEIMGAEWKANAVTPIQGSGNDFRFVKIVRIIPPRQKSLNEARGYVVADYQDYLEQQWIAELRNEFAVKLNNDVMSAMIKK